MFCGGESGGGAGKGVAARALSPCPQNTPNNSRCTSSPRSRRESAGPSPGGGFGRRCRGTWSRCRRPKAAGLPGSSWNQGDRRATRTTHDVTRPHARSTNRISPAQVSDGWRCKRDAKELRRLVEDEASYRAVLCVDSNSVSSINAGHGRVIPRFGHFLGNPHELRRRRCLQRASNSINFIGRLVDCRQTTLSIQRTHGEKEAIALAIRETPRRRSIFALSMCIIS